MRAALQLHSEHPEITARKDALLRASNDRLGALIEMLSVLLLAQGVSRRRVRRWRRAGGELGTLGTSWLAELGEFAQANAEDTEEAIEEAKRERGRDGG